MWKGRNYFFIYFSKEILKRLFFAFQILKEALYTFCPFVSEERKCSVKSQFWSIRLHQNFILFQRKMFLPSMLSSILFLHYHCCHIVFSSYIIFMMRASSQNLYQATATLVSARISWECSCWVLKHFLIRIVCFTDLEPFWGRCSFF